MAVVASGNQRRRVSRQNIKANDMKTTKGQIIMTEIPRKESSFRFLDKAQLLKLRNRAMRSGVWFKALRRIDRVLVDLTIRVANSIRSVTLANSILAITRKLQELQESKFSHAASYIGSPIARNLSTLAQKWGNKRAKMWANDKNFIRYLTIMSLNGNFLSGECGTK